MKNTEQKPWHATFDAEITFPRGETGRIVRSVQSYTGAAITVIFERDTPDGTAYLTDPSRPITSSVAFIFGIFGAQVKEALPEQTEKLKSDIVQMEAELDVECNDSAA